jgi:hypothetical protein
MAGVVWYAGGVALLRKETKLVLDAHELRPDESCAALAVSIGLVLGAVKARFIFSGSCRRNLTIAVALLGSSYVFWKRRAFW